LLTTEELQIKHILVFFLVLAAITKYHGLGIFHNRKFFLCSGSWKVQGQDSDQSRFHSETFRLINWPQSHHAVPWSLLCEYSIKRANTLVSPLI
jgi:hypothetical protein